jgi:hypothetical protein
MGTGQQSAFEFLFSRSRLFAGESGGLESVSDRDFLTGFSTHGIDPFDPDPGEAPDRAPVRSANNPLCFSCHFLPGVFSFNTFVQNFSAHYPGVRPGSDRGQTKV